MLNCLFRPPIHPSRVVRPLPSLLTTSHVMRRLKRTPILMTHRQSHPALIACNARHGHALTRATWSTTNGMDAATLSPLRGSPTKATSAITWLKGEFSAQACCPLAGGPPGACKGTAVTTNIMAAGLGKPLPAIMSACLHTLQIASFLVLAPRGEASFLLLASFTRPLAAARPQPTDQCRHLKTGSIPRQTPCCLAQSVSQFRGGYIPQRQCVCGRVERGPALRLRRVQHRRGRCVRWRMACGPAAW